MLCSYLSFFNWKKHAVNIMDISSTPLKYIPTMIVVSQSIVNSGLESEASDYLPLVDMCELNSPGFLDTDSSQLSTFMIWEDEIG